MGDGYRRQGTSEYFFTGLGVAPTEGVDTGPHDGGDIFNDGLGVAPKGRVDTGPHDGGNIFNSGLGVAPKGRVDTGPHGRKGDWGSDERMARRESVGAGWPAAAARGLGSAWRRCQTRRPSQGQQPLNAAATRR